MNRTEIRIWAFFIVEQRLKSRYPPHNILLFFSFVKTIFSNEAFEVCFGMLLFPQYSSFLQNWIAKRENHGSQQRQKILVPAAWENGVHSFNVISSASYEIEMEMENGFMTFCAIMKDKLKGTKGRLTKDNHYGSGTSFCRRKQAEDACAETFFLKCCTNFCIRFPHPLHPHPHTHHKASRRFLEVQCILGHSSASI